MDVTAWLKEKGVLGFRSGKKWKMLVAGVFYFFVFLIFLGIICGFIIGPTEGSRSFAEPTQTPLVSITATPIPQGSTLTCPNKGLLQSDIDYCVSLCMVNRTDSGFQQDNCQRTCEQTDYYHGNDAVIKAIQNYKCQKCGECTPEQLTQIAAQKQQNEKAQLHENCTALCINETSKVYGCNCTDTACWYAIDKCKNYEINCVTDCDNNKFIPYEQSEIKKEDDQQRQRAEQKANELAASIEAQSNANNGYVFITNISGEPREYGENGINYDFPYPTKEPVKVPVDIGKKLIATGYFSLAT